MPQYSTNIELHQTKTNLHEAIAVTGSILSGTFALKSSTLSNIFDDPIGNYQICKDYARLSASCNDVVAITQGYRSDSGFAGSHINPVTGAVGDVYAKQNIYNEFAAMMLGYNQTGSVKHFDVSGNFNNIQVGSVMDTPTFFCFSRLVVKDEIKKGSFSMVVDTGSWVAASQTFAQTITISDSGSSDVENGLRILKITSASSGVGVGDHIGLLDRYRGIAAIQLSASYLNSTIDDTSLSTKFVSQSGTDHLRSWDYSGSMASASIVEIADAWRHRIKNISLKNTTQLNNTNYICHVGPGEFTYSTNPSYVNTSSQVRIMLDNGYPNVNNLPYAYATGITLYAADGTALATGKFSYPLKMDGTGQDIRVKITT